MTGSNDLAADFQNVFKKYRGSGPRGSPIRALDGVSFRVGRGEAAGLLGPNRAGKTTLVKILLNLCRPTSGAVYRLGRPIDDLSTLARVGYVHEHPALPRYLRARDWLEFSAVLTGFSRTAARARRDELLDRVGLLDRAREPIARFSKGMVQRLALAQALMNDPELLVLDEPSEGLDLSGRRLVGDLIRERRSRGCSVILVTHLAGDAESLCDRIVVVREGRVVHEGGPNSLTGLFDKKGPNPRLFEQALWNLYQAKGAASP